MPFKIEVTPVKGGVDIKVIADEGMKVDAIDQRTEQGDSITLHVRDYDVPRKGSCVMVGGRLVKVAERRYNEASGQLWVFDEDTHVWHDA